MAVPKRFAPTPRRSSRGATTTAPTDQPLATRRLREVEKNLAA